MLFSFFLQRDKHNNVRHYSLKYYKLKVNCTFQSFITRVVYIDLQLSPILGLFKYCDVDSLADFVAQRNFAIMTFQKSLKQKRRYLCYIAAY